MTHRLEYRRYRLPFRVPVRTGHGLWTEREGLLIRLEAADGIVTYGEVAPIPDFGTETVEHALGILEKLGAEVTAEEWRSIPEDCGCLRAAFNMALASAAEARNAKNGTALIVERQSAIGVAALLPAGRNALQQIDARLELGFRTFKWKVGVGVVGDELSLLDDILARLPTGAKVRLDANGALDRRQSERWLERCADRPIEFFEQPVSAKARGADDLLQGLAADYPTPLALDESLVGSSDVERWIGRGWAGIYVVKPTLLAEPTEALKKLEKAKASVVFSSALETGLAARAALDFAFRWKGEARALGFGVWPLFEDARFDGPFAAPYWRSNDVERLNPEALWNALS